MAKLNRLTAKIFGETASTTNTPKEIGQFGSAKAGTYNATGDVATIQSLSAWSNGWIDAVTPTDQFPPLPEMTGVHKVLSYQNAYLLQQGIPEWDSATTYYEDGFCAYNGIIYKSLTNENLDNQPDETPEAWFEYGSGDYANQDISNLTAFGNARLQYAPFAINSGTVSNGKNATLFLPGGSQTTVEVSFNQPIMSANGTVGGSDFAVFASSEVSSAYAWKAFDGDTGYTAGNVWEATGFSPQYIGWYNPNPMKMDSLTIRNGFSDSLRYVVTAGEIQYSNDGTSWTTEQTFTNSVQTNGAYWTINIASPVLSNYKRIYITSATNTPMIANIQFNNAIELVTITASATVICDPCTITTCDSRTLVDDGSSVFEITDETDGDYFIFKNYTNKSLSLASSLTITNNLVVEPTWTQPVLSANGTLGGSSFAVSTNNQNSTYPAWKAFDGSTASESNEWVTSVITTSTTQNVELIMYNPDAIKVTNISVTNRRYDNTYASAGNVYGSNDNSSYTLLKTFTNSVSTALSSWNIDLNTNTELYKYYKIVFTGIVCAGSAHYFGIAEIDLTATEGGSLTDGALWLDTSVVSASLKVYDSGNWTINNDLVWIGNCSVSGGAITGVKNRAFNDSGFVLDKFLVENYQNGSSWYRVYYDGWCEQGGQIAATGNTAYTSGTITFLKPFKETYGYNVSITGTANTTAYTPLLTSITSSSVAYNHLTAQYGASWIATGYVDL